MTATTSSNAQDRLVVAYHEGKAYTFIEWDIVGEDLHSVYGIQGAADILAANIEEPITLREDGTVELVKANFNDCFRDMWVDLTGQRDD